VKGSSKFILVLLLIAGCARHQRPNRGAAATPAGTASATVSSSNTSPRTNAALFTVISRGPHHRVWASVTWHTNGLGRLIARTNSYTELASGMARLRQGSWVETTTDIYPAEGGATATNTGHQVFFAVNPNVSEALRLTTPDGKVLSSHVLSLSYFDASTGSNAVIAELHDSVGQITDSNKVLYPAALQGDCIADIEYENKKSGLEQNIVIKTRPPSPIEYSMNPSSTLIQVWSEFVNTPAPVIAGETPMESGVIDQHLDFGAMKMGPGKAFFAGQSGKSRARVFKQWVNADNRAFLVEQTPVQKFAAEIQSLPAYSPGTGTNFCPSSKWQPAAPNELAPGRFSPPA